MYTTTVLATEIEIHLWNGPSGTNLGNIVPLGGCLGRFCRKYPGPWLRMVVTDLSNPQGTRHQPWGSMSLSGRAAKEKTNASETI